MISLKLKAIAFFIDKNDRVVDVGCDHAYLDIYLVKNGLCKNIIASDINENALNIAKNNIQKNVRFSCLKKAKWYIILMTKNKEVVSSMKNEAVPVEISTKTKKILKDSFEIVVLEMNSNVNNNENYHISVECLNLNNNARYENIDGSFFYNINDANEYFEQLVEKYTNISINELENILEHIK